MLTWDRGGISKSSVDSPSVGRGLWSVRFACTKSFFFYSYLSVNHSITTVCHGVASSSAGMPRKRLVWKLRWVDRLMFSRFFCLSRGILHRQSMSIALLRSKEWVLAELEQISCGWRLGHANNCIMLAKSDIYLSPLAGNTHRSPRCRARKLYTDMEFLLLFYRRSMGNKYRAECVYAVVCVASWVSGTSSHKCSVVMRISKRSAGQTLMGKGISMK